MRRRRPHEDSVDLGPGASDVEVLDEDEVERVNRVVKALGTLPAPGDLIDVYRILEPLGEGGSASVFLARDTKIGREVALKVLRPPRSISSPKELLAWLDGLNAQVGHEARSLDRATSPAVVAIHHIVDWQTQGVARPCLVMEYVAGRSLEWLDKPIPPARALHLVRQIVRGLAAFHARGIVHRDLKPGNVLVTPRDEVKITDFGLAFASSQWTGHSAPGTPPQFEGTPEYMAPEQLLGGVVDERSDLWAVGMILYELLVGRRPWTIRTRDYAARAGHYREKAWPELKGEAAALTPILRRLLAIEPGGRFASAAELLEALAPQDRVSADRSRALDTAERGASAAVVSRARATASHKRYRLLAAIGVTLAGGLAMPLVLRTPTPPWQGTDDWDACSDEVDAALDDGHAGPGTACRRELDAARVVPEPIDRLLAATIRARLVDPPIGTKSHDDVPRLAGTLAVIATSPTLRELIDRDVPATWEAAYASCRADPDCDLASPFAVGGPPARPHPRLLVDRALFAPGEDATLIAQASTAALARTMNLSATTANAMQFVPFSWPIPRERADAATHRAALILARAAGSPLVIWARPSNSDPAAITPRVSLVDSTLDLDTGRPSGLADDLVPERPWRHAMLAGAEAPPPSFEAVAAGLRILGRLHRPNELAPLENTGPCRFRQAAWLLGMSQEQNPERDQTALPRSPPTGPDCGAALTPEQQSARDLGQARRLIAASWPEALRALRAEALRASTGDVRRRVAARFDAYIARIAHDKTRTDYDPDAAAKELDRLVRAAKADGLSEVGRLVTTDLLDVAYRNNEREIASRAEEWLLDEASSEQDPELVVKTVSTIVNTRAVALTAGAMPMPPSERACALLEESTGWTTSEPSLGMGWNLMATLLSPSQPCAPEARRDALVEHWLGRIVARSEPVGAATTLIGRFLYSGMASPTTLSGDLMPMVRVAAAALSNPPGVGARRTEERLHRGLCLMALALYAAYLGELEDFQTFIVAARAQLEAGSEDDGSPPTVRYLLPVAKTAVDDIKALQHMLSGDPTWTVQFLRFAEASMDELAAQFDTEPSWLGAAYTMAYAAHALLASHIADDVDPTAARAFRERGRSALLKIDPGALPTDELEREPLLALFAVADAVLTTALAEPDAALPDDGAPRTSASEVTRARWLGFRDNVLRPVLLPEEPARLFVELAAPFAALATRRLVWEPELPSAVWWRDPRRLAPLQDALDALDLPAPEVSVADYARKANPLSIAHLHLWALRELQLGSPSHDFTTSVRAVAKRAEHLADLAGRERMHELAFVFSLEAAVLHGWVDDLPSVSDALARARISSAPLEDGRVRLLAALASYWLTKEEDSALVEPVNAEVSALLEETAPGTVEHEILTMVRVNGLLRQGRGFAEALAGLDTIAATQLQGWARRLCLPIQLGPAVLPLRVGVSIRSDETSWAGGRFEFTLVSVGTFDLSDCDDAERARIAPTLDPALYPLLLAYLANDAVRFERAARDLEREIVGMVRLIEPGPDDTRPGVALHKGEWRKALAIPRTFHLLALARMVAVLRLETELAICVDVLLENLGARSSFELDLHAPDDPSYLTWSGPLDRLLLLQLALIRGDDANIDLARGRLHGDLEALQILGASLDPCSVHLTPRRRGAISEDERKCLAMRNDEVASLRTTLRELEMTTSADEPDAGLAAATSALEGKGRLDAAAGMVVSFILSRADQGHDAAARGDTASPYERVELWRQWLRAKLPHLGPVTRLYARKYGLGIQDEPGAPRAPIR